MLGAGPARARRAAAGGPAGGDERRQRQGDPVAHAIRGVLVEQGPADALTLEL